MNTRLNNLSSSLEEAGLNIRIAGTPDVKILQEICDAWIEKGFFEGETLPSDYIEQCLKNGDLPPIEDAKIENYALYVVEKNQRIIGLFDLYEGYPDSQTAWISLLLLDIESRGAGIGKKLLSMIADEYRKGGFDSLGLAVSMNNRIALKFWVNHGFKEILGIFGDLKYPVMGLKMKL